VSPGTYLVINHSTGERFTDVTVSGTSTPAPTGISVVGGTISWPDDGWYQVQAADGSATICNGGSSCEVDPGQYLVINHTTGQRFPGVVVSEDAGPPRPPAIDAVTVTGNVITMPEDGWYQVQTADGSESVCNGETSCEVPAGRYLVINHTTGERFEDIVVGGSTPVTPPSGVDSVTVDGTSVRWPDDGWYQVQNADTFESVCEGGVSCDVAPGTYFVINLSTGERQTVSVEDGTSPPAGSEAVEVSLDIMVPAYSSEALQVRVMSGDARVNAAFVVDESWSVTAELAANTDYPLSVVFFDDNGAITLASVETRFTTSSDEVQEFQITADQFDSDRWDTDGDGTSNLDELRAGRDPLVADTPGAVDSDFRITVANGDSGALSVSVGVPDPESGQLGGDFMILFDRSGSFGDDLATFRREVDDIELALSDNFSNFRIGLASFVDAPCRDFGSGSDFGYELNLPMGRPGMLSEALDELDIRFGNDGPESQLEAMRQAMTGEGHIVDSALSPSCSPVANIMATSPGWTDDRVKFLLVSTDAEFHRPTDFEYPYQTTVQDVINLASESKTTILFLNSGSTDVAAGEIVFATGVLVSNLGSASQEIVSVLKSAVASTISSVEVFMEPVGDGAEFVTSIEPDRVELNLFEDRNVEFQVNLLPELEPSAIDRVFTFELVTEAQGAEISRLIVELTVPAD
jgi:hypothetical protein